VVDLLIVVGTLGLGLAASFLVLWSVQKYLAEYAKRTETKVDDMIVSVLKGPVVLFIVAYGVIWLVRTLAERNPSQASTGFFDSIDLAWAFVLVLVGTWLAAKLFVVAMHRYPQRLALKTPSKTDDLLVGISTRVGKIVIIAVGITIALGLLWLTLGLLRLASGQ